MNLKYDKLLGKLKESNECISLTLAALQALQVQNILPIGQQYYVTDKDWLLYVDQPTVLKPVKGSLHIFNGEILPKGIEPDMLQIDSGFVTGDLSVATGTPIDLVIPNGYFPIFLDPDPNTTVNPLDLNYNEIGSPIQLVAASAIDVERRAIVVCKYSELSYPIPVPHIVSADTSDDNVYTILTFNNPIQADTPNGIGGIGIKINDLDIGYAGFIISQDKKSISVGFNTTPVYGDVIEFYYTPNIGVSIKNTWGGLLAEVVDYPVINNVPVPLNLNGLETYSPHVIKLYFDRQITEIQPVVTINGEQVTLTNIQINELFPAQADLYLSETINYTDTLVATSIRAVSLAGAVYQDSDINITNNVEPTFFITEAEINARGDVLTVTLNQPAESFDGALNMIMLNVPNVYDQGVWIINEKTIGDGCQIEVTFGGRLAPIHQQMYRVFYPFGEDRIKSASNGELLYPVQNMTFGGTILARPQFASPLPNLYSVITNVAGNQIIANFDIPMAVPESVDAFTVTVWGVPQTISSITLGDTSTVLLINLETAIPYSESWLEIILGVNADSVFSAEGGDMPASNGANAYPMMDGPLHIVSMETISDQIVRVTFSEQVISVYNPPPYLGFTRDQINHLASYEISGTHVDYHLLANEHFVFGDIIILAVMVNGNSGHKCYRPPMLVTNTIPAP